MLESVKPLDCGPREEKKATRNVCWRCAVRWWSRKPEDSCPKCGASFADRDKWKSTPFASKRLECAREFQALTQDELAAKVGGMPIAAFEAGEAVPTFGEIRQLASVLDFPPGFLTNPKPMPELDGIHFWCNTSTYCEVESCGNYAVAYCDQKMPGGGTCDAPICGEHGINAGDDIDYCEKHARIPKSKRAS